jgi:hypothetical protein
MNTQLISPETKIKIDNFINEVLSNKKDEETDFFEIKPSLIAEYLVKNGFEECDNESEEEIVFISFSKENRNYNSETDDEEEKYFLIRLCINYMENRCYLDSVD